MLRSLAPAAVLVTVVLSACGTTAVDNTTGLNGEQKQVAETIDALSKASARRDTKAFCGSDGKPSEILAAELVKKIEQVQRKSCRDALIKLLSPTDSGNFDVNKVTVKGDTATAAVTVGKKGAKQAATLGLVKQDGSWKISELGSP